MLHKRACCQFSVCIILHGCNAVVSIACPREDMRFCRPAQKLSSPWCQSLELFQTSVLLVNKIVL